MKVFNVFVYLKDVATALYPWVVMTPGLTLLYLLCHVGSMVVPGMYGSKTLIDCAHELHDEIRMHHTGTQTLNRRYKNAIKRFQENFAKYTEHERDRIEDLIQRCAFHVDHLYLVRLEHILLLPREARCLDPLTEGRQLKEMLLDSGYGKEVCKSVYSSFALLATSLKYDVDFARPISFLLGPPGAGKTRLVEKIASTTGLPLLKVRVDVKSRRVSIKEQLFGSEHYPSHDVGSIVHCLTHQRQYGGTGNENKYPIILFFDELDKILNTQDAFDVRYFILNLLNGDSSMTEAAPGLNGCYIDMKKFLIICAANEEIKTESETSQSGGKGTIMVRDEAMMSRLQTLEFHPYTQEAKGLIVEKLVLDLMTSLGVDDKSVADPIAIEQLVSEDEHPGMRVLKTNITRHIIEQVAAKDGWELDDV